MKQKLTISRDTTREIQKRFVAGNTRLVAENPPLTLADLTPDYDRYPDHGNFDQVLDQAVFLPLLREMIKRFNSDLWLERARTKHAEAQRAALRGNSQNVERFLALASEFTRRCKQAAPADREEDVRSVEESIRR